MFCGKPREGTNDGHRKIWLSGAIGTEFGVSVPQNEIVRRRALGREAPASPGGGDALEETRREGAMRLGGRALDAGAAGQALRVEDDHGLAVEA